MKILKYSVTAVIGQYLCRSYPLLCKEKALIFFFIFYKNSSNCYYFYVRTVHFYCLLFIICTNKYTHVYMYIYIYIYINILHYMTSAQQAKMCNIYQNIKLKLWKTNTAIWFNKMCRTKQLSARYIRIKGALVIKFNIYICICWYK